MCCGRFTTVERRRRFCLLEVALSGDGLRGPSSRPNGSEGRQAQGLMVKVPAAPEGLPAIEHLIGEGISINITLLSAKSLPPGPGGLSHGLEKHGKRRHPSRVASVASFFVSRIGRRRRQLDDQIAKPTTPAGTPERARRARSRSPTPKWPTRIKRLFRAHVGTAQAKGQAGGCCGRQPAPRTRTTAMCSMSRS